MLDSGQVTGLLDSETKETLAVIYYMASTLDSESHVSISKVRAGTNGYSCMIMVTLIT